MGNRRRQYSPEFKARVVLELLAGDKSMAQLCREHQIKDSVINRWRQQFVERSPELFESRQQRTSADEARIAELERMIGRLTLELEASKKASNWLSSR